MSALCCLIMAADRTGRIFARRSTGYFEVRRLDGTRISAGVNYKKLRLLQKRKNSR